MINYELPNVPETYVHRIGRTGRAGASGIAISFCDAEERAYLKDIQKLIKQSIPVVEEHPFQAAKTFIAHQPAIQKRSAAGGGNRNGNSSFKEAVQATILSTGNHKLQLSFSFGKDC